MTTGLTAGLPDIWQRAPLVSVGVLGGGTEARARNHELAASDGCLAHFDVTDGLYSSFRAGAIADVAAAPSGLFKDVHLLVSEPAEYIHGAVEAGADAITVQADADDVELALDRITKGAARVGRPILRGLALRPGMPLDDAVGWMDRIELLLILGVEPGEGSTTLPGTGSRVHAAAELPGVRRRAMTVSVDGGITPRSAATMVAAGADVLVCGSALTTAEDPRTTLRELIESARRARRRGR